MSSPPGPPPPQNQELIYVRSRENILNMARQLIRMIVENVNYRRKTKESFDRDYINRLNRESKYRYINDYTGIEENIFNVGIRDGCNLLMVFCFLKEPLFCSTIINNYGDLFNLGAVNRYYQTALIISIRRDTFDITEQILDYRNDPFVYDYPNIGQVDALNRTALDYMLGKFNIETRPDGVRELILKNPNNEEQRTKMYKIIADLLRFYLDSLHHNPESGIAHSYINIFCRDRDVWRPVLSEYFEDDDRMDFNDTTERYINRVCDNIVEAKVELGATVSNRSTRQSERNRVIPEAREISGSIGSRILDENRRNYIERNLRLYGRYLPPQIELRIPKRLRDIILTDNNEEENRENRRRRRREEYEEEDERQRQQIRRIGENDEEIEEENVEEIAEEIVEENERENRRRRREEDEEILNYFSENEEQPRQIRRTEENPGSSLADIDEDDDDEEQINEGGKKMKQKTVKNRTNKRQKTSQKNKTNKKQNKTKTNKKQNKTKNKTNKHKNKKN
jgi:hypothetical protein